MIKLKNILGFGVVSVLLAGCVDLDQYPHDSLANEDSFNSITDALFWTNGMYESLRESTYGRYMTLSETQADLLDARRGTLGGKVYRWEEFTASEYSTQGIWAKYYRNIANINNAMQGFGQIPTQTDAEAAALSSYTGEMYLARALYYSRLMTLFCADYDPATASTTLGLPILLAVQVKDMPSRSTLQATYDQIFADIAKAESLLSDEDNAAGAPVLTKDAALLLKSRLYLYKKDWAKAYEAAIALISSGRYPLASSESELRSIWYNDNPSESLVMLPAALEEVIPEEGRNTAYIGYREYSGYGTYIPDFLPNQWVVDLYEEGDIRKSVYFAQKKLTQEVAPYAKIDLYLVYKYPGNPRLKVGKVSGNEHSPKIFRIAEAYLIAAEAAYMKQDEANATKYLNLLREARGASLVTAKGAALLQEIKHERVRELSFEGFRLMDLKRWKEGVDRASKQPQNIDFIVTNPAEQTYMLTKSADDYRMVWPIPSVEIFEIGKDKLIQNPGW